MRNKTKKNPEVDVFAEGVPEEQDRFTPERSARQLLRYLTHEEYLENAAKNSQWKSHALRWPYHQGAMDIIRGLNIADPGKVLEIGSFGAGLVHNSVRMDLPWTDWEIAGASVDIRHDARDIPWPFHDGEFDLIVALRVWHHLDPVQKEAFLEARRVAKYVLIECPEHEVVGVGISRQKFTEWNGGPAMIVKDFADWGLLYLFSDFDAAYLTWPAATGAVCGDEDA
jgi:SAM-dependent methyltransferase